MSYFILIFFFFLWTEAVQTSCFFPALCRSCGIWTCLLMALAEPRWGNGNFIKAAEHQPYTPKSPEFMTNRSK